MLIKCEKCSTLYEVPEKRLNSEHPRFFKCSACGNIFAATKEEDSENESIIPAVEQSDSIPMALSEIFKEEDLEKVNQETSQSESNLDTSNDLFEPIESAEEFTPIENKNTKHLLVLRIIFILFLTFIAIVAFLYIGRFFFVRQTPIAEDLYKKVGVETNVLGEGLSFQNTVFDLQKNTSDYELLVRSEIFNTTGEIKTVPTVIIHLLDNDGNVVQSEYVHFDKNILEAGEILSFNAQIKAISDKARRIEITFERDKK